MLSDGLQQTLRVLEFYLEHFPLQLILLTIISKSLSAVSFNQKPKVQKKTYSWESSLTPAVSYINMRLIEVTEITSNRKTKQKRFTFSGTLQL